MTVTSLIKEHGKLLLGSEYIGRTKNHWIAVPTGVQTTGQIPCACIDHFKTICRARRDPITGDRVSL